MRNFLSLKTLTFSLLIITFSLYNSPTSARPFFLVLSNDDLHNDPGASADDDPSSSDWDDFDDDGQPPSPSELDLDPGSWRPVMDPDPLFDVGNLSESERVYYAGVEKMVAAASGGEPRLMIEAVAEIGSAAEMGCEHAQSVMGFLYGSGQGKERSVGKGFLYHYFAAKGGNLHSKMAVAYNYHRQEMYGKAVKLYAELAKVALKSFLISKDSPLIEHVRLHTGSEENTDALKKLKGEDDDDFQILDYQAQKGNSGAMYKVGLFYYFGLRGLRRDRSKALHWFTKAAERGEPRAMEFLGEMYAKGAGVERNYTKALEWLRRASKQLYSAYNGLGYLYVKGYGVEGKNFTKAKMYFEKAADNDDAGGHYNLGVVYLKGIGVKRDVSVAWKFFAGAASAGQPKALYQLAKMAQTGMAIKKDLAMATSLYKVVAERGPWSSLSRWALESYLNGDIGKALLLYSRMAELGYEFAQSNAAWILDKYGENGICLGEAGFCTDVEIHQRAHSLWWQASEQGNEQAALLIGDAYYYGRGTERDYERAAEAYMHAKSHSNAQAIFNLGYMHEHGQGLPFDLHLAKRYYDHALAVDPAAKLPVTLALASLWIRKNYENSFLVHIIDSLPEVYPKIETWVDNVLLEEGNATILTLIACLLTVLYLRDRQRRHVGAAAVGAPLPPQPNDHAPPAPH